MLLHAKLQSTLISQQTQHQKHKYFTLSSADERSRLSEAKPDTISDMARLLCNYNNEELGFI